MQTVVVIGDSLVEGEGDEAQHDGWVGRIRAKLPRNQGKYDPAAWRVFNLGIGGNTILDIEARLAEVLVRKPDMVLLGCAYNDAKLIWQDGVLQPKVTPEARKAAWGRVLEKLRDVCPRVLVVPGAVVERDMLVEDGSGMRRADFDAHMVMIAACVKGVGAEFLELPLTLGDDALRNHGVHWNAKGYTAVAEVVWKKLCELGWVPA